MHAKGISSVSFVENECPQDDNRENLYSNGTDLVTNANGSSRVGFFTAICMFVFLQDISETDEARIAKQ